jgi:hypothetical protein
MREPSTDIFRQREKGLEEAFFKDRDQKLIEKMRGELEAFEEKKKLAHVSGIVEERVLHNLAQAGVRAETLAAVSLIPLVEVAWVDGAVSPEERDAVLNAAVGQGVPADSAAYEILKRWLQVRPDPHIFVAWKDYVTELIKLMPPDTIAEMTRNLLDRCTRVAEAAGGFLGLATISKSERAKIDEFAKILRG